MKMMKLTLVIKALFVIWLSALLINMVSSSSGLYGIGSIGFKHFVYSISQSSGELMSMSGLLLYPIILLWCILNYKKIKGYIQKKIEPVSLNKADRKLMKEATKKEWFGYACLFLASMLLVDTFLYNSLLSLFRGDTQSQGMPKRVFFLVLLTMFHNFRSIAVVVFVILVCVYAILWLVEWRKLSK